MSDLHTWAARWGLSIECVRDLQTTLGLYTPPLPPDAPENGKSEAWTSSVLRLEASQKGVRLWRNNVGALKDETGRVVRYGLANDSAALNKAVKSSDFIGWRPRLIVPADVGHVVGQTVLRETKPPGWQYTGTEREAAQWAFLSMALADGCDAAFATGPGTLLCSAGEWGAKAQVTE